VPDGGAIALRPRSFGELFDHAITLYIRNFIPFSIIELVQLVPVSAAQTVVQTIAMSSEWRQTSSLLIFLVSFFVLWPLTLGAAANAVSQLYGGSAVDVRACYREAFRRWGAGAAAVAVGATIMLVLAVLALIVTKFFFGPQMALFSGDRSADTIAIGSIGFPIEIASWTLLSLFWLGTIFAVFALMIEKKRTRYALASGFGMAFDREGWWRILALAFGQAAIVFAEYAANQALKRTFTIGHDGWVPVLILLPWGLVVSALMHVLLVVYYYDVRIRRDAIDVQEALERLSPMQPA
jgi:hypothetical protein